MHSVVILAAGKGTRMKSPTPKVMHKICNRPMLFCIIDEARKISCDVHVILGHGALEIQPQLTKHYSDLIVHLQDLSLYPGTAGALMSTKPAFKYSNVLILNGDMPLLDSQNLEKFLNDEICVGIFSSGSPQGYGRALLHEDELLEIIEEKDCTEEQKRITTLNAGIYSLKTSLLESSLQKVSNQNAQCEYYLTDIIQILKEHKKRAIFLDEQICMGVNSKAHLALAEDIMLERLRVRAMESGVIMHNPKSIFIDFDCEFKGECEIYEGVRLEGCFIEDSVIKSHSVLEQSKIISSTIGPLAHVRPNSIIENGKIGNFVEIKSSKITSAKVNHLSYIGDAEIGQGCNVGAGVITCNYDGKKKSATKIGKNVFIGSDVQLIAPLEIEDNVLIAAGSTVTKDCKSGELVISRSEQKSIKDGFHRFFKDSKKS